MKGEIGAVIIGMGLVGGVHRRAIASAGGVLRGVVGSSLERSEEVAGRWRVRAYPDAAAAFADRSVDVVHICTPNAFHHGLAKAALLAGKHVVCEKPLAMNLLEARELAELARSSGRVGTVPFVYRYHPMAREARARVLAGEVGPLQLIHGSYLQDWLLSPTATNWRVDAAQGGASRAFADIGSHWCDLVEWTTGERFAALVAALRTTVSHRPARRQLTFAATPRAVGEGEPLLAVDTEDVAGVLLRTAADTLATVTISQVSPGRKNRLWFEIDGAEKSLIFDQEAPEQLWVGSAEAMELRVKDPTRGSAEQRRLAVLPAGLAQGYLDCFEAFVGDTYATIRGEAREGVPTFADGLRSAQIVDAVLRSARQGSWVPVEP
ncbi:MAG TPA: Gfo/Idh/MocA family oxidoreductase [Anaeromyxobacteraceae bacterium]|nr:Gfo/Idh/MocA family oxidoreductase [Anaeromyxobacteraceae bacterium]